MSDAEPVGDPARVVNVLSSATTAAPPDRLAMVVELQGDANDLVALLLSNAATTEELTPPDIATTTRRGRRAGARLLEVTTLRDAMGTCWMTAD